MFFRTSPGTFAIPLTGATQIMGSHCTSVTESVSSQERAGFPGTFTLTDAVQVCVAHDGIVKRLAPVMTAGMSAAGARFR